MSVSNSLLSISERVEEEYVALEQARREAKQRADNMLGAALRLLFAIMRDNVAPSDDYDFTPDGNLVYTPWACGFVNATGVVL